MKQIVLIGGSGTIGKELCMVWNNIDAYQLTVIDIHKPAIEQANVQFVQADATNEQQLEQSIPETADVIINLLKFDPDDEVEALEQMTAIYFEASIYIFELAVKLGIPRVVFASSNHVTDFYEQEGKSQLGREISVHDYPYSRNIYGILKLASENAGHMYANQTPLSVINLRIGSVPDDAIEKLERDERVHRTLLTKEDLVQLFTAAVHTPSKYGTFYGVSSNESKPWDMKEAYEELHFRSQQNTKDLLEQ